MGKSRHIEDSKENWISFIGKIQTETNKLRLGGAGIPYYRGHYTKEWELIPDIFRDYMEISNVYKFECMLACDFHSLCGQLYENELDDWEMTFEMRHAGLPTRLLDWTENFANALFFSIAGKPTLENIGKKRPCIWILDPYKLNKKSYNEQSIPESSSLDFYYHQDSEKEWDEIQKKFKGPIAIIPSRAHQRIFAQKSLFTVHSNPIPIEKYYRSCVKKIEIPIDCFEDAELFLFLAGVNYFSLFPDLDGLGKYLRQRYDL